MTSETLPAAPAVRRTPVYYSLPVVRAFLARVASGEPMSQICKDPTMPGRRSVCEWAKTRPMFGARLKAARLASGHIGGGSASTYCPITAQEIFRRLCEGESVTAICRDPAMPCFSTVYLWRRTFPEFRETMRLAREIQAERYFDEGWEIATRAAPDTAYLTHVQLTQLRWMMGHMAPRTYGRTKPLEADVPPLAPAQAPQKTVVVMKHFRVEEREDGYYRVIALIPDGETGKLKRVSPEDDPWHPPPARWRRRANEAGSSEPAGGPD